MKVAVHNGEFHADDVFSVAVLHLFGLSPEIIRTRNPEVLAACNMRIDVGRKYCPTTGDFDHHQEGGAGVRENGVPYAAFGLIWKKYGVRCSSYVTAQIVDERLVQPVDASDVGYDIYALNQPSIMPYLVSDAIRAFNPTWTVSPTPLCYDRQFAFAVETAKALLINEINQADADNTARVLVYTSLRDNTDPRILVMDKYCSWQNAVSEMPDETMFVVCPYETNDRWMVYAVPEINRSRKYRRCLPVEWKGKAGPDLARLTGVSDAIFCHNALFCAAAWSKEGAIKLAELALK